MGRSIIIETTTHVIICTDDHIIGIPFDSEPEKFAGLCSTIESTRIYVPKNCELDSSVHEVLKYYEATFMPLEKLVLHGTKLTAVEQMKAINKET